MPFPVRLAREVPADAAVLAVPVFKGRVPAPGGHAELDLDYLASRGFEGRPGESQALLADDGTTIVAVGLGDAGKVDVDALRRAGACIVRAAWHAESVATTLLDALPEGSDRARAAQALAEGAVLASYRFDRYKSSSKPCRIESITVVGKGAGVQNGLDRGVVIGEAVAFARDLINEPAGAMTPRRMEEAAREIAEAGGLTINVLDEVAIENEGLGGLHGVSLGSDEPPRLIELVYEPTGKARGTIALVGKGITFDSGGLSLKSGEGMMTMKTDMSGAAAVLATMRAIAALKPKTRVIGMAACSENLPSGRAIKPGDVLKIRNGKTVEVLNTDAEGRLVLADGLSLAVEAGADAIVDIATLTGACVMALGKRVAGLMGNHEAWVEQVRGAADRAGEAVWHLPLPEVYRKDIDSEVADIKNIGNPGGAGALTAGLFLREFVGSVPWAHLDIAGPSRADAEDAYITKGGTGFGTATLIELVTSFQKPGRTR